MCGYFGEKMWRINCLWKKSNILYIKLKSKMFYVIIFYSNFQRDGPKKILFLKKKTTTSWIQSSSVDCNRDKCLIHMEHHVRITPHLLDICGSTIQNPSQIPTFSHSLLHINAVLLTPAEQRSRRAQMFSQFKFPCCPLMLLWSSNPHLFLPHPLHCEEDKNTGAHCMPMCPERRRLY